MRSFDPMQDWIVDECTTPNGVAYEVNVLWTGDDGETRTDTVAEVNTEYADPELPRKRANLLAAAPDLLAALKRVEWSYFSAATLDFLCPTCCGPRPRCSTDSDRGHRSNCTLAAAIAKAEGLPAAS
jgi:hypothetical protein